jgi:regulator of protease activity HflC (stomatin/prohibitin superfamily)
VSAVDVSSGRSAGTRVTRNGETGNSMGIFHLTVHAHERALEQRDGRLGAVLGPGRHRRRRRTTYQLLDVRERLSQVAPQEVLTADGVTVKVSAAMRWSIIDPHAFVLTVDPEAIVYLAVQVSLREQLATLELAAVVREGRRTVAEAMTAAAREAGLTLGMEILAVVVKDVVLPAEIRTLYAEMATARQRGQVQLETARAETAALRSMANAAKILDDHPALAQLRLVQSAPYGTKIVLQVRDGAES